MSEQLRTLNRQVNRGVPYLFLKPTRGAIIGDGDDILMPFGRDRIEWEVEMAIVFGRSGKYISADRAYDHVFGYMVAMDISDRGGRPPGGYGSGFRLVCWQRTRYVRATWPLDRAKRILRRSYGTPTSDSGNRRRDRPRSSSWRHDSQHS